jgi:hypothetical protein
MIQVGRSRVRFPMRWISFNWPYPPSRTIAPGVDSVCNRYEYQDSSCGVKGGRRVRLTTLPPSMSWLSKENVGASVSEKPMGLHCLLQEQLYLFCLLQYMNWSNNYVFMSVCPSEPSIILCCRSVKVCNFTSKVGFLFCFVWDYRKSILYEDDIELTKKSTIYWDMTPCSPVEIHRRFGETYCIHFQCRKISQKSNKNAWRDNQIKWIYLFLTVQVMSTWMEDVIFQLACTFNRVWNTDFTWFSLYYWLAYSNTDLVMHLKCTDVSSEACKLM